MASPTTRSVIGGYVGDTSVDDDTPRFYSICGMLGDPFVEEQQTVTLAKVINDTGWWGLGYMRVYIEENTLTDEAIFNLRVKTFGYPGQEDMFDPGDQARVHVPAGETGWFEAQTYGTIGFPGVVPPGYDYQCMGVKLTRPATGTLTVGSLFVSNEWSDVTELSPPYTRRAVQILGGSPNSSYGGFEWGGSPSSTYEVRLVGSYEDQSPERFGHYMGHSGAARNLRIYMTGNSRDGDLIFALGVNGVASALRITIPAADTVAGVYLDTTNEVTLAEGDRLTMILVAGDTPATTGSTGVATWSVQIESDSMDYDVVSAFTPSAEVSIFSPDTEVGVTVGGVSYQTSPTIHGEWKCVDTCSISKLRMGYEFYGYSVGENDLPFTLKLTKNGADTGVAITVDTPTDLSGDFAGDGFGEDSVHKFHVSPYGNAGSYDVMRMRIAATNPGDVTGLVGINLYPAMMAFTVMHDYDDPDPDPPSGGRKRLRLFIT